MNWDTLLTKKVVFGRLVRGLANDQPLDDKEWNQSLVPYRIKNRVVVVENRVWTCFEFIMLGFVSRLLRYLVLRLLGICHFKSDVFIIFWTLIKEVVIFEFFMFTFIIICMFIKIKSMLYSYNFSVWRVLHTWGLKLYNSIFKLVRDRLVSTDLFDRNSLILSTTLWTWPSNPEG